MMVNAISLEQAKVKYGPQKERLCMNCGNSIEHEGTNFYERRFCSTRCKTEYCEVLSEIKKL